ncbi:carbohydrate kinase family protein, partial [Nonomuraea sp. NPDC002799]
GGSLAAPGWGDIADWWHEVRAAADHSGAYGSSLARRYAFLDRLVPTVPVGAVRRAVATVARYADVGMPPQIRGQGPDEPEAEDPGTPRVPAQKQKE